MSQTLVIFSPESYSVTMSYDNMGGIVQKNQTASLNYPGYPGEKYNYYYTQGNTAHPHATSKVWDRRNHKQYTYGFDGNGNPTTTHEQYAPPLQGQPNPSGPIDLIQQNYWDEQNQLRGLWNLSGLHHYIYDADGQRLMKSSVPMSYSSVNAQQLQATNSIAAEDYTVYVSAGLVYESNRGSTTYTKHYYAGPLRVASQIGSENPNYERHPVSGGNIAPGGPANTTPESYGVAVLSDLNTLLANYGMAVDANEPPQDTLSMQVINDPDECKIFYGDDVIEENRCLCDNFPDIAIQQGKNCNPYTPIYWYHPDYIGNIEFVTDRTGQPYQHFYYAAFGDPMVSQHVGTGNFNSTFRFNAKEFDEETGNYYYGARYYEPKSSVWMGVDALATSYPGMNPYNFVMGNPIMAVDPDGNSVDGWVEGNGKVFWDENTNSQEEFAENYKGQEGFSYVSDINDHTLYNIPDGSGTLVMHNYLGGGSDGKGSTIIDLEFIPNREYDVVGWVQTYRSNTPGVSSRNVYKTLPDRFTSYMLDGPGELQRSSDLTQSQYFHGKQGAPELNGMLSDSPMRYLRYDAEYPVEFVAKSTPIINNERPLFTMTWGFQINSQSETIDLRPTIDFNPMPFNGSYFTDAHQIFHDISVFYAMFNF